MRRALMMAALLAAGSAQAAETISYSYDARGRLIQASRTGTVNNLVVLIHTASEEPGRNADVGQSRA